MSLPRLSFQGDDEVPYRDAILTQRNVLSLVLSISHVLDLPGQQPSHQLLILAVVDLCALGNNYLIQIPPKKAWEQHINPFITEPSRCRQKPPGRDNKISLTRVRGRVPKAVAGRSNSSACPPRPTLTSVHPASIHLSPPPQLGCMDLLMGPGSPPYNSSHPYVAGSTPKHVSPGPLNIMSRYSCQFKKRQVAIDPTRAVSLRTPRPKKSSGGKRGVTMTPAASVESG